MPDPLYDEIEKEDIPAPEAIPVPEDVPVEGPQQFEQPPAPAPGAPGPDVQAGIDDFVPPVPAEAPGNIGAPAPLPGGPPPPGTVAPPADMGMDIAKRQGEIDKQKAAVGADEADKQAAIAQERADDERLAHADYLERRTAAQDRLAQRIQDYEERGKIVDPRVHTDMTKARLSVIFGGLGAAFRSAGGGSSKNEALEQLQTKWADDLDRQKANIGVLKDSVAMARAGVKDVDDARAELNAAANAKTLAQYNGAIRQGEKQLKDLGMDQATIDGDARIQSLLAGRRALAAKAQKEQDEHDLAQAKAKLYLRKAGVGGGAGGISAKEQRARDKEARDEQHAQTTDAAPTIKEMNEAVKEFTAKGGVKEAITHGARAISVVEKDPNNNTNWTNLIDSMIRSNTGRSAILSQYKLYTGHATGDVDLASQYFHKLADGGLSDAQKKTILGAAKGSLGQLQSDAKDFFDNFRGTYDQDPRISNPKVAEHYKALERTTFGTLPGYQKPSAPAAAPAPGGSDPRLALARKALTDPAASPTEKAQAAKIIKAAVGGR
jgi:hypothetical protein